LGISLLFEHLVSVSVVTFSHLSFLYAVL